MTDKRKFSKKRLQMGEEAWSEYQKQRKNRKSNKYRLTNSEKVISSRRRKKETLVIYKGGKCERCGLRSEIFDIYDFHHKDPKEKEFAISKTGKNWSIEKLKSEADKCLLVCKNCHAIIHYEINQERIRLRQLEALEMYNKKSGDNLSIDEFLPSRREVKEKK